MRRRGRPLARPCAVQAAQRDGARRVACIGRAALNCELLTRKDVPRDSAQDLILAKTALAKVHPQSGP